MQDARSASIPVVRVGVFEDGRLVAEGRFRANERVTLGSGTVDSLTCTSATDRVELFTGDGLRLQLPAGLSHKSRVTSNHRTVVLDALASPSIDLEPGDRARLELGRLTVLIQVVLERPVSVAPIRREEFRPALLDLEEPAFGVSLAWWSALALLLSVWVWSQEAPRYELDHIPDYVTRVAPPPPRASPPEVVSPEPRPEVARAHVEPKRTEPTKSQKPPAPRPTTRRPDPEAAREALLSQPMLARLIAQTGDAASFLEHGFDDDTEVTDALDAFAATRTGIADDAPALRRGAADAAGPATIGALASHRGPAIVDGIGGGPEVVVSAPSSASISPSIADREQVAQIVRRHRGALRYCYEQQLKADPDLGGRVEVGWAIESGRPVDVFVVGNTTGSRALEQCLMSKIARWRFPAQVNGDVSWPFVFRAQK